MWSPIAVGVKRQIVTTTATSSYRVTSIRLYADTTLYFEATITPIDIPAGAKIQVTVTIEVKTIVEHEGGVLRRITITGDGLESLIERFTIGTNKGVKPVKVALRYDTTLVDEVEGSVTVDLPGRKITFYAEYLPTSDKTINIYEYVLSNNETFMIVEIEPVTLSALLTHTFTLTILL